MAARVPWPVHTCDHPLDGVALGRPRCDPLRAKRAFRELIRAPHFLNECNPPLTQ